MSFNSSRNISNSLNITLIPGVFKMNRISYSQSQQEQKINKIKTQSQNFEAILFTQPTSIDVKSDKKKNIPKNQADNQKYLLKSIIQRQTMN